LVGGIDAKLPGIQAATEKFARMMLSYLSGRTNYLVGVLAGLNRFSAEEAIIELELAKYIHAIFRPFVINNESIQHDLIKKQGPGGNFFGEDHTMFNFQEVLWLTDIFDSSKTMGTSFEDKQKDILANANKYIKEVMAKHERYHLSKEKEKEIDKIVKKAEEILLNRL
jgi:trimethylamine---corrinoid protein Co-methyltransferase